MQKKVAPPLIPEDKIHWSTTLKALLALTRDSMMDRAHALAPAMSERVASIPESVRGAMPGGNKIWSPLSYAVLAVLLGLRFWMGWRTSRSGQVVGPPAVAGEVREGDEALLAEVRGRK